MRNKIKDMSRKILKWNEFKLVNFIDLKAFRCFQF